MALIPMTCSLPSHHNAGFPEKAVDHYQQAIQLSPSHHVAVVNLGRLYRSLGENSMAEEWYRRYSTFSPPSRPPGAISSFHRLLSCRDRQAFRTGAHVTNSSDRTVRQGSHVLTALTPTAEATVLAHQAWGGRFSTLISPIFWSRGLQYNMKQQFQCGNRCKAATLSEPEQVSHYCYYRLLRLSCQSQAFTGMTLIQNRVSSSNYLTGQSSLC